MPEYPAGQDRKKHTTSPTKRPQEAVVFFVTIPIEIFFLLCYTGNTCGCSSSVELRLPKPIRWVRLPSSAPFLDPAAIRLRDFSFPYPHTAVTALRRAWRALPRPNKKILAFRARVTITTRIFIYIIIFSILLYSSLFCSILFYSSLFCSMYRQEADVAAPSARRRLPPAERRAAAGFSCGGIIYLITAE